MHPAPPRARSARAHARAQLSTEPERFFVGELVREKLFEMFDDEVPYSSTVEVETFKEAREAGRKDEIHVAVVVERDGQKGIIIGKVGTPAHTRTHAHARPTCRMRTRAAC